VESSLARAELGFAPWSTESELLGTIVELLDLQIRATIALGTRKRLRRPLVKLTRPGAAAQELETVKLSTDQALARLAQHGIGIRVVPAEPPAESESEGE
jgi:hypothetical protein